MNAEAMAENLAKFALENAPGLKEESELQERFGDPLFFDDKGKITGVNQPFFAAWYRKQFNPVYDPDEQRFYLYNPAKGLWEPQTEQRIISKLAEMLREYARKEKIPDLVRRQNVRVLSDIMVFLKAEAEHRKCFERSEHRFIHCANGVLVFDNVQNCWTLREFSPEDYSRNRSEIEYIPGAGCPRFLDELISPAMSEADADLLQLYAGQCLIGVNISQTFLVITGTPGGGKSTLVNILEAVIGRHNCTELRLDLMNRPFETFRLLGKTLLTAKDVSSRFLNSAGASKLKALTGNDTQTAEMKGVAGGIDFVGCFNAIITSNSTLRVTLDGDSAAWRRRMLWIKYENPPPKEPVSEFDRVILSTEASGVLNWMLAGAAKLLRAGGRISRPPEQQRRVDDLLLESDSVSSFIADCVKPDGGATVTINEMLIAFNEYCDQRGWQPLPERVFQKQLPDAMLNIHRAARRNDIKRDGKCQKGYSGMRLTRV